MSGSLDSRLDCDDGSWKRLVYRDAFSVASRDHIKELP
jgi:hypothetical protein